MLQRNQAQGIRIQDPADIQMVSVSTTLATNAIAEGKSTRVALLLIGYDPELIASFKMESRFATPRFYYFAGGHDLHGREKEPLDLEAILASPYPPEDKLKQVVWLLLQYVEREREIFPLYLRELVRHKSSRAARSPSLEEHEERIVSLLTRLFSEGIGSKKFINVNPRLLAYVLKGMVRAVGYYQMTEPHRDIIQEDLPVVLQLLISGIVLPPETVQEEDAI